MKRIVILSIIVMLAQVPAHAQLGGLIQKAAAKTTKVLEKKADSVINSAMDKQLDKQQYPHQWNLMRGTHDWDVWSQCLSLFLQDMDSTIGKWSE